MTFVHSKQSTLVTNSCSAGLAYNLHHHRMLFAKPIFLASSSNCLPGLLNTNILYRESVLNSSTLKPLLMTHSINNLLFLAANLTA